MLLVAGILVSVRYRQAAESKMKMNTGEEEAGS